MIKLHKQIILDPKLDIYHNHHKTNASLFLINLKYLALSPFTLGYVCPNIHLIHYVENHILFQEKNNFGHLTRSDVATVWLIAKKMK